MKKRILPFLIIVITTPLVAQQNNALKLNYNKPATHWLEALPIGNGSMGGMVFGGIEHEQIPFNEQSLCTGSQTVIGAYQPFGDVFIEFQNVQNATNYSRELDLNQGVHKTFFTANGVQFERQYFANYPDKVLVFHVKASKKGKISCKIKLTQAHNAPVQYDKNKAITAGKLENQLDFEAQILVHTEGGKMGSDTSGISVSNATTLTIFLAAGTSYIPDYRQNFLGEHPHKRLENDLNQAVKKGYKQLLKTHIADYQNLFNRVKLDLGTPQNGTITERLTAYQNGKDPALEALLFQYGRYLLMSSSRKGGLPANLQGLWNNDLKPAWYSQYTTNINVEMNYWLAEQTNLSECHEPLLNWIENIAAVSKRSQDTALKTAKGWIIYSTNNIFGGGSKWRVHRPGSAWLSQHLWEHFAFTGDTAFLKNRAYPILKEVVEYWEGHLVEHFPPSGGQRGANTEGVLITPDGWSPEHGPNKNEEDKSPYAGASYDQQIIYDLFSNYIEAAKITGFDAPYCQKIEKMRQKLLKPQIGKWGQLQEWMDDVDDPTDHHRHNSHLFAVHPGRQISPLKTPELAKAAIISLDARGDKSTGWSSAWKMNLFARLHQANRAYKFIRTLLRPIAPTVKGFSYDGGSYPNLFGAHPPFQMDSNFGYTSGVTEMLLQSHLGEIHLLPALPDAWQNGSVTGLKARGGVEVSIFWKNGQLEKVVLKAQKSGVYTIRYGNMVKNVELHAGKIFIL